MGGSTGETRTYKATEVLLVQQSGVLVVRNTSPLPPTPNLAGYQTSGVSLGQAAGTICVLSVYPYIRIDRSASNILAGGLVIPAAGVGPKTLSESFPSC